MAKKQKPWGIDDVEIQKEVEKTLHKVVAIEPIPEKKEVGKPISKVSGKEPVSSKKEERKILKVYEEAHRRAKFMAFEEGMKLTDFVEHLINGAWEKRDLK